MIAGVVVLLSATVGLAQSGNWPTTDWVARCNPEPGITCDLADSGVTAFGVQLEEASRFLESLGFRPPDVFQSGTGNFGPYVAYVQKRGLSIRRSHVRGYFSPSTRSLVLEYADFFSMGSETSGDLEVPAHELFHAIQSSYDGLSLFDDHTTGGDWVTEGLAEAVRLAYGGQSELGSDLGKPMLDTSLHDFFTRSGKKCDYLSYPFWLHVAKTYGGRLPESIRIFHDFYLAAQRNASAGHSIKIVDRALREFASGGLYAIYPQFIAEYGNGRDRYIVRNGPTEIIVNPDTGFAEKLVSGTVKPVAANAEAVTAVNVWGPLDGSSAEVQIRIVGPNQDDLHLVVADKAYNTPAAGADGFRNLFVDTITSDMSIPSALEYQEYFARVVNAARETDELDRDRAYTLQVSLFREFVDVDGKLWSEGPSPEDIDSPIPMDMEPTGVYIYPHASDRHAAAGFSDPCLLRIFLRDKHTGDRIAVNLDNDGKFAPGEYSVASLTRYGDADTTDHPGQALAGFRLTPDNAATLGREYLYYGVGGVLEIKKVTPRWIVGSVRIAGARQNNGDWTDAGWVDYPGDLANLEVSVDFSLRHRRPANADQYLDVKTCIAFDEPSPDPKPIPKPKPKPTPIPDDESEPPDGPGAGDPIWPERPLDEDIAALPPDDAPAIAAEPSMNADEVKAGDPRFSLVLKGARTARIDIAGPALAFTGQCGPRAPLFLTMFTGDPDAKTYANLAFATAVPVEVGTEMAVPDVRVKLGASPVLAGPATLVIERLKPGLAGRITGALEDGSGAVTTFEAGFDVSLACGP